MRELQFIRVGRLEWRETPEPRLQADREALVRPVAVARCDLDAAVLRGEAPFRGRALHLLREHLPEAIGQRRIFRNAPFKGPYPFGHECVAEIVTVGDAVRTVRPGQRVIVPFQINCGECPNCRRGLTGSCTAVPPRSMYGFGDLGGKHWGGALAEVMRVPFADAMLVPLPAALEPGTMASAADNIPDGWRTVGPHLRAAPGADVLVVGGGAASIGLYAAGCAVAAGAGRVDYVDRDGARLALAGKLGATPRKREEDMVRLGPYRITVDASADPHGLALALRSTEPGGVCTSVGIYYPTYTPVPLREMYGTGVTFITGRANVRACLCEVVGLAECGRLHPEVVTGRRAGWEDAPEALLDPCAKVVVIR